METVNSTLANGGCCREGDNVLSLHVAAGLPCKAVVREQHACSCVQAAWDELTPIFPFISLAFWST